MRKFSVLVCFFVLLAASAIAQETKKITGKVTDGNGEVLSGVTVVEFTLLRLVEKLPH